MLADVLVVAGKELRELWNATRGRSSLLRIAIWFLIFGVMFPVQTGRPWLNTLLPVYYWTWLTLFYVGSLAVGAFAGEREVHTLESLLATRLPDAAILLGKMLSSVVYGWGLVVGTMLTGLVGLNVSLPGEGLLFYDPLVLAGGLALSLLGGVLMAGVAVLVSLRAETARQAAMTLSLATLLLFMPILVAQFVPAFGQALMAWIFQARLGAVIGAAGAVLLAGALAVFGLAMARFKRAELILD